MAGKIAITAKCTDYSLLVPDVFSKLIATRALGTMASTAQVQLMNHLDIMQCFWVTSKTTNLCTVVLLLPGQTQTDSRLTCLSASTPSSLICWGLGAAAAGLMGLLTGATVRAGLTPGEAVGCGPTVLFGCAAAMVAVPSASAAGFVWYNRLWLLLCITYAQLITLSEVNTHSQQ